LSFSYYYSFCFPRDSLLQYCYSLLARLLSHYANGVRSDSQCLGHGLILKIPHILLSSYRLKLWDYRLLNKQINYHFATKINLRYNLHCHPIFTMNRDGLEDKECLLCACNLFTTCLARNGTSSGNT